MNTTLWIVVGYLGLLVGLGIISSFFFRRTSSDFFVASRSIGPFMLLMSVFGTTMTAFALVGSTGKAFSHGIGAFGLMASWSGLVHSAVFFLVGIRLWAIGKRHGYVTQCQFFRERFQSPALGYVLFPILIGLIIPYLLIGLLGAAGTMKAQGVPPWLTGLVLCSVVLVYVFFGGIRSTVWANTFQTMVFMIMGVVAFVVISKAMGGFLAASQNVLENRPDLLSRGGIDPKTQHAHYGHLQFFSYFLVPLSVGMFPHVFQHWLTARSAKAFRLTVIAHPICILIVWLPCILIGIWAAGHGIESPNPNAVLGKTLAVLVKSPVLSGLLLAGILAAIMSSLDSQFMCMSTMFTHDIADRLAPRPLTDKQKLVVGRIFVVLIVATVYGLSLLEPRKVFELGVWCFSGFSGLFPIVFAAVYWRRVTKHGAMAAVLATTVSWIALFWRADFGKASETNTLFMGAMPVLWIVLASTASLIVVSLLTRAPDKAHVDRFFSK